MPRFWIQPHQPLIFAAFCLAPCIYIHRSSHNGIIIHDHPQSHWIKRLLSLTNRIVVLRVQLKKQDNMSLRPDHRSSRSRSKSRERSKSRSRTHERAPSPGPALTADARYSYASPSHDVRAPSPVSALTHDMSQYEIREPSQPAVAMPQPVHAGNPYERISNAQYVYILTLSSGLQLVHG